MNDLLFRRAAAADLPAIVALLADDELGHLREAPGLPLRQAYLDAFAAIDRDPNQFLCVVEEAGAVVGTLQLSFVPGISHKGSWRAAIEAVRIARERRGTGLGERMMDWAIEQARARGCAIVQHTTDKARADAQRFYARLGFRASHVGFKRTL